MGREQTKAVESPKEYGFWGLGILDWGQQTAAQRQMPAAAYFCK